MNTRKILNKSIYKKHIKNVGKKHRESIRFKSIQKAYEKRSFLNFIRILYAFITHFIRQILLVYGYIPLLRSTKIYFFKVVSYCFVVASYIYYRVYQIWVPT
jgi:hypothetical protein